MSSFDYFEESVSWIEESSEDHQKKFEQACEDGDFKTVQFYLSDPKVDPNSGLFLAATNGHIRVINKILEDKRVSVSGKQIAKIVPDLEKLNTGKGLSTIKTLLDSGKVKNLKKEDVGKFYNTLKHHEAFT